MIVFNLGTYATVYGFAYEAADIVNRYHIL